MRRERVWRSAQVGERCVWFASRVTGLLWVGRRRSALLGTLRIWWCTALRDSHTVFLGRRVLRSFRLPPINFAGRSPARATNNHTHRRLQTLAHTHTHTRTHKQTYAHRRTHTHTRTHARTHTQTRTLCVSSYLCNKTNTPCVSVCTHVIIKMMMLFYTHRSDTQ
jgi:hypothetical protein